MPRQVWSTEESVVDVEDIEDMLIDELIDELARDLEFPEDASWTLPGKSAKRRDPGREHYRESPDPEPTRTRRSEFRSETLYGYASNPSPPLRTPILDEEDAILEDIRARLDAPILQERDGGYLKPIPISSSSGAPKMKDRGTSPEAKRIPPERGRPAAPVARPRVASSSSTANVADTAKQDSNPKRSSKPKLLTGYKPVLQKFLDSMLLGDTETLEDSDEEELRPKSEATQTRNIATTATQTSPEKGAKKKKGKQAPKKGGLDRPQKRHALTKASN